MTQVDQSMVMSIEAALAASISVEELTADSTGLYWIESRPAEQGRRTVLCMPDPSRPDEVVDCTPEAKVRSRLHSYGGGVFAVLDGWLVWVDDASHALSLRSADGHVQQLTEPSESDHFGGLSLSYLDGHEMPILMAVREQASDIDNSVTQIVTIDLADRRLRPVEVPDPWAGADFVACPVLRPDGLLAWTQWQRPAMAWDASCLLIGQLNLDTTRANIAGAQLVAGRPDALVDGVGVQRPQWSAQGSLRYLSDESGDYQVHCFDPSSQQHRQLTTGPFDHDLPQWTAQNLSYASLPNGDLVAASIRDGRATLCRYAGPNFEPMQLAQVSSVRAVTVVGQDSYALVDYPDRPSEIIALDGAGGTVLRRFGASPDPAKVSSAESMWAPAPNGAVHAWFYPPNGAQQPAPLLVMVHGGPTDMHTDAWNASTQYWTERGIAVLDVNYAGSSGFGRAYRNRLRENWGIADVADVIAATEHVLAERNIDPKRVAIVGGSAGGFTVLNALIHCDLFAGGISKYGIADLTKLVGGPKFESRYLDSLIGPWPQTEDRYRERSPLHRAAEISSPLLILQGSDDPIVPLEQATMMAQAAQQAGVDVELVVFDGEEHGFRSPQARAAALTKQTEFLGRIFDLDLS